MKNCLLALITAFSISYSNSAKAANELLILSGPVASAPAATYVVAKSFSDCDFSLNNLPTAREFESFALGYWQHAMKTTRLVLIGLDLKPDLSTFIHFSNLSEGKKLELQSTMLQELAKYCEAHPELTFSEAVENSAGIPFVVIDREKN